MKPFKKLIFCLLMLLFLSFGLVFSPYGYNSLRVLGGLFFGTGIVMFIHIAFLPAMYWVYDWFTS